MYQMKNNKSDLPRIIQYVFDIISEKDGQYKPYPNEGVERNHTEIAKLVGSGERDDIQSKDGST